MSVPLSVAQHEQAKARHTAGIAPVHIVVAHLQKKARHASRVFQSLVGVLVERGAGGTFRHAIQQGVGCIVVGPARSGIGHASEATVEGAEGIGHQVAEAAAHGELVTNGDFQFVLWCAGGPSGA